MIQFTMFVPHSVNTPQRIYTNKNNIKLSRDINISTQYTLPNLHIR
jgi:hypothetical protein